MSPQLRQNSGNHKLPAFCLDQETNIIVAYMSQMVKNSGILNKTEGPM